VHRSLDQQGEYRGADIRSASPAATASTTVPVWAVLVCTGLESAFVRLAGFAAIAPSRTAVATAWAASGSGTAEAAGRTEWKGWAEVEAEAASPRLMECVKRTSSVVHDVLLRTLIVR
jgi:hypothetical protein